MKLKITRDVVALAERYGASTTWLEWARDHPRGITELPWNSAVWLATNVPLPEELAEALEARGCGRSWWRDGRWHRDDGPAVESSDGTRMWYREGKLHRDDGPAVEWAEHTQIWYWHGERHREDGPAVETPDLYIWYRHGKVTEWKCKPRRETNG